MCLFLVLPFHGFSIPFCWLVQGFETFPTLPTKPSEIVFYGSHGFRKRKQRKIRDVLLGGQDSFVIPAGTDFTHFWSCFFLFRRYVISNFYFSKYSTLIRLLSLLNHWFCCNFTFLAYLLFSQKNEFEYAEEHNRKIFIKPCPICLRTSFLFSLDKSYLVQPLRIVGICVVLCVYFVTLSILLALSSIDLYLS